MAFNAVPGIAGHGRAYGQGRAHNAWLDPDDAVVEEPGSLHADHSLNNEFAEVYTVWRKKQIVFQPG